MSNGHMYIMMTLNSSGEDNVIRVLIRDRDFDHNDKDIDNDYDNNVIKYQIGKYLYKYVCETFIEKFPEINGLSLPF